MHYTASTLADLADEFGHSPATLAIAWVASHPGVAAPIISARSVEQLAPSLAAMSFEMDADLRPRLSALSPAPVLATNRSEELEGPTR